MFFIHIKWCVVVLLIFIMPLAGAASIDLVVNGTLMRGLALEKNMTNNQAVFIREAKTKPIYRMWSINDQYPAMQRVDNNGTWFVVEVWKIPEANLMTLFEEEPAGLSLGKIVLDDGSVVLGMLGENYITIAQADISKWNGWRAYTASLKAH